MESRTPAPGPGDGYERLAEFVGRLLLLLVAIVHDHPRWLPKRLREEYRVALAAAYPSIQKLQATLLDPEANDRRGATEITRLLQEAGLSDSQLDLKLAAYYQSEARFYGGTTDPRPEPDRLFSPTETEVWRLPAAEAEPDLDGITTGSKQPRSKVLAEPVLDAANSVLGSVLGVFHISEAYKEIKEGVEWGIKNWKLLKRLRNAGASGFMKLRGLGRVRTFAQ
jgi:hypothetical protein